MNGGPKQSRISRAWTRTKGFTHDHLTPTGRQEMKGRKEANKEHGKEKRLAEIKAAEEAKAHARPGVHPGAEIGEALPKFNKFFKLTLTRGAEWVPGTEEPLMVELLKTVRDKAFLDVIETGEKSVKDSRGRSHTVDLRTLHEQKDPPYNGSLIEVRRELAKKISQGEIGELSLDEMEIIYAAMVGESVFPGTGIPVWGDWGENPEHEFVSSPPDAFFDMLWMFSEDSGRAPEGAGKTRGSIIKELMKNPSMDNATTESLRMQNIERGLMDTQLGNSYIMRDLLEFLNRFGNDVLAVSEAPSEQIVTDHRVPGLGASDINPKEVMDKLEVDLLLVVGGQSIEKDADKELLANFAGLAQSLEAFKSGVFTKEAFEALEKLAAAMEPSEPGAPKEAGKGSSESRAANLRDELIPPLRRETSEKSEEAAALCKDDGTVARARDMLDEFAERHLPEHEGELPDNAKKLLTELKETLKVRAELLEVREKKASVEREIRESRERRISSILTDIESLDAPASLKRDLAPMLAKVGDLCSQERPALQRQASEEIVAFEEKYSPKKALPAELRKGLRELRGAVGERVTILGAIKVKEELITELKARKAENEARIAPLTAAFGYSGDRLDNFRAVMAAEGSETAAKDTLDRLETWARSQPTPPGGILDNVEKLRNVLSVRAELSNRLDTAQAELEALEKSKAANQEKVGELASPLALTPVQKELDTTLKEVKSLCAKGEEKKAAELLGNFNKRMKYPLREVCMRLLEEYEKSPVAAGHRKNRKTKFSEAIITLNVCKGGESELQNRAGTKKRGAWLAKKMLWLEKSFGERFESVKKLARRMYRYIWHERLRHGWRGIPILAPFIAGAIAPAVTIASVPLAWALTPLWWSSYPIFHGKYWLQGRPLRNDLKLIRRLGSLNAIANDALSEELTEESAARLAITNSTATSLVAARCRMAGERLGELENKFQAILDRETDRYEERIKALEESERELLASDISKPKTLGRLVRVDRKRRELKGSKELKLVTDLSALRAERKQLMEGAVTEESSRRIREIESEELGMLKAGSGKVAGELLELHALTHDIMESEVEKNFQLLGQALAKSRALIPADAAELAALAPESVEEMRALCGTHAELLDGTMEHTLAKQVELKNERKTAMAENARLRSRGLSGIFWASLSVYGLLAYPIASAYDALIPETWFPSMKQPHFEGWEKASWGLPSMNWGLPPAGDWPVRGDPLARWDKNQWLNPNNWKYKLKGPTPDTRGTYVLPEHISGFDDYTMRVRYNVGNVLPEEVEAAKKAGMDERKALAHAQARAHERAEWLRETTQASPFAKGGRKIPSAATLLDELEKGKKIQDIVYENVKDRSKARSNSPLMPWRERVPDELTDLVLSREPYSADRLVNTLMSDPRFAPLRADFRSAERDPLVWELYGMGYVQRRVDRSYAVSLDIHKKEHVDFLIANPILRSLVSRWSRLGADELHIKDGQADKLVGFFMAEATKAEGTNDVVQMSVEEPANAAGLLRASGVDAYLQGIDRAHAAMKSFAASADRMNLLLTRRSEANKASPDANQAAFFSAVDRYLSGEKAERDVLVLFSSLKEEDIAAMLKDATELRKDEGGAKKAKGGKAKAAEAQAEPPKATPGDAKRLLAVYDEYRRNVPMRDLFIHSVRKYAGHADQEPAAVQAKPEAAPAAGAATEAKAALPGAGIAPASAPATQAAKAAVAESTDPLVRLLAEIGAEARGKLLYGVVYARIADQAVAKGMLERRGKEFGQRNAQAELAFVKQAYHLKTDETARFVVAQPALQELLGKLLSVNKTAILKKGQEELLVREIMVHKRKKGFIYDFDPFRSPESPKVKWAVRAGLYIDFATDEKQKKEQAELEAKALSITKLEKRLAEITRELEGTTDGAVAGLEKELAALKTELAQLEGEAAGLDRAWIRNVARTGQGIETRKAEARQAIEAKKRQVKEAEDKVNALWTEKKDVELRLRALRNELTEFDRAEQAKQEASAKDAAFWDASKDGVEKISRLTESVWGDKAIQRMLARKKSTLATPKQASERVLAELKKKLDDEAFCARYGLKIQVDKGGRRSLDFDVAKTAEFKKWVQNFLRLTP